MHIHIHTQTYTYTHSCTYTYTSPPSYPPGTNVACFGPYWGPIDGFNYQTGVRPLRSPI